MPHVAKIKVIRLRCDEAFKRRLKAVADAEGLSVSALVRHVLLKYCAANEPHPSPQHAAKRMETLRELKQRAQVQK